MALGARRLNGPETGVTGGRSSRFANTHARLRPACSAAFYLASFFSTASGRHMIASVWLWLQGRLPLRSTEFLDDAHTRGALRQIGGIYQFRHARLQDRLGSARTDLPAQGR
jgi:hypothetical protein